MAAFRPCSRCSSSPAFGRNTTRIVPRASQPAICTRFAAASGSAKGIELLEQHPFLNCRCRAPPTPRPRRGAPPPPAPGPPPPPPPRAGGGGGGGGGGWHRGLRFD